MDRDTSYEDETVGQLFARVELNVSRQLERDGITVSEATRRELVHDAIRVEVVNRLVDRESMSRRQEAERSENEAENEEA